MLKVVVQHSAAKLLKIVNILISVSELFLVLPEAFPRVNSIVFLVNENSSSLLEEVHPTTADILSNIIIVVMIDPLTLITIATVLWALWLWFGKKGNPPPSKGEAEEKIYIPSYTKKVTVPGHYRSKPKRGKNTENQRKGKKRN